jgi:hypothetical protein
VKAAAEATRAETMMNFMVEWFEMEWGFEIMMRLWNSIFTWWCVLSWRKTSKIKNQDDGLAGKILT